MVDIEYRMRDANYFGQFQRKLWALSIFFTWNGTKHIFHVVYAFIIEITIGYEFYTVLQEARVISMSDKKFYFLDL